jgi:uncharacterized protein with HEPN domain
MADFKRDKEILQKIVGFCNQLDETKKRFGDSEKSLEQDEIYKAAASMFILQIGELTTYLSPEFKKQYNGMPWQDIKDMRNIAAHHYGNFRTHYLWDTMNNDIAPLRGYCLDCIELIKD